MKLKIPVRLRIIIIYKFQRDPRKDSFFHFVIIVLYLMFIKEIIPSSAEKAEKNIAERVY